MLVFKLIYYLSRLSHFTKITPVQRDNKAVMNKLIKKIVALTKGIRYFFDPLTFHLTNSNQKLEELRNSLKNKPILIVGNGPSLNKTPLDDFHDVYSIGMNKIDLIFDKTNWRPNIVITQNSLVARQHWRNMARSGIPHYLNWNSRWLIPFKSRKFFHFFLTKPNNEFQKDISQSVGASGTVTYAALQFAYHLGANPIVLVGVDHNFKYTDSPNDYQKRKGDDNNHFDPNYFADGQYWGVPNLDASEVGFKKAKSAFDDDGRKVLDATIDGKLKVFEKISIEQAIEIFGEPG